MQRVMINSPNPAPPPFSFPCLPPRRNEILPKKRRTKFKKIVNESQDV